MQINFCWKKQQLKTLDLTATIITSNQFHNALTVNDDFTLFSKHSLMCNSRVHDTFSYVMMLDNHNFFVCKKNCFINIRSEQGRRYREEKWWRLSGGDKTPSYTNAILLISFLKDVFSLHMTNYFSFPLFFQISLLSLWVEWYVQTPN